MIQILRVFLLTLAVLLPALDAGEPARDFTSSDGKVLRATLVNANDEKVILVRASDQRQFILPLDRLSAADQEYIQRWAAKSVPVAHPLGWERLRLHAPPGT